VRVLVVHNRYRSEQPSGENAVVDSERALLEAAGCSVELVEVASDDIAAWPAARRATVPFRVVWSRAGARLTSDAVTRFRPDVVHFHNTFPLLSPAALRAAHRAGAAVVQTLHNFRPLCPAATFVRDGKVCESCLGRIPLPAVVHGCYRGSRLASVPPAAASALHGALGTWTRSVELFLAPTEFTRGKYVQAGWPADRIVVKPNTVADPGVHAGGARSGFVFLGRLTPEKGIDVLLRAWRLAFPDGDQVLHVVGAGPEEAAVRAAAADTGGVVVHGPLEPGAASALVRDARALVVPSRWYEVFPRVVVEAYALGTPVVASRIGSLAEIVVDGVTGRHAEAGDAGALAEALSQLASGRVAERLGHGARAAYECSYHPDVATAQLLRHYDEALRRRHEASVAPAPRWSQA
jgi:glycosyltransferase involved in cell wall biosynthesis